MVLSPKSSVKLLADPSRFEKREVQLTVYYHTHRCPVHMVSVLDTYLLSKALVKQGGYTRFHLATVSLLKAQMRILPKATTSTSLNVILGQITKAK